MLIGTQAKHLQSRGLEPLVVAHVPQNCLGGIFSNALGCEHYHLGLIIVEESYLIHRRAHVWHGPEFAQQQKCNTQLNKYTGRGGGTHILFHFVASCTKYGRCRHAVRPSQGGIVCWEHRMGAERFTQIWASISISKPTKTYLLEGYFDLGYHFKHSGGLRQTLQRTAARSRTENYDFKCPGEPTRDPFLLKFAYLFEFL